jgi:hypothetical protein
MSCGRLDAVGRAGPPNTETSQDVKPNVLDVVPMDIDVATGSLDGRVARVLTSSTSTKRCCPSDACA